MLMQSLFWLFFKMTAPSGHLRGDAGQQVNICDSFAEDVLGEKDAYETSEKRLYSFKSRRSHQTKRTQPQGWVLFVVLFIIHLNTGSQPINLPTNN